MPVNWDKKSFSLPARSSDADPEDFGNRWNETFKRPAGTEETQKVETFEIRPRPAPAPGITYPTNCAQCGEPVGEGDHHWALSGKVQCTKCGPFVELEG